MNKEIKITTSDGGGYQGAITIRTKPDHPDHIHLRVGAPNAPHVEVLISRKNAYSLIYSLLVAVAEKEDTQ